MRLSKIKRKNSTHYYIIESYRDGQKVSSRIIKKLGSDKQIRAKYKVDDVDAWAQEQLKVANSIKQSDKYDGGSTQYKGAQYIQKLYCHFGLDKFMWEMEKRAGCKKNSLNNLLLLLILDCLYFPNSVYANLPYFQEGYFRDQQFDLGVLNELYKTIADNSDYVLAQLIKYSDIRVSDDPVMFFNIELDKSLILPEHDDEGAHLGIMCDSSGVPFALLHSCFADKINADSIDRALNDFGFVDIYSNGDKFNLENMLPSKASFKKLRRLSLKEAKTITNADLAKGPTWQKFGFEQKSFMRGLTDFFYKKFSIKGDKRYVVVAIYSNVFDMMDSENRINMTSAMLDNPQCDPKIKSNVNNYVSNSIFNSSINGYRFYLLPKEMPVELAINFDFTQQMFSKNFNIVPYSNSGYVDKSVLEKYTIASQIIYYIAWVFAQLTIKNSKYYISSIVELSFFLQNLDSAAFSSQFKKYLNQLLFRLDE